MKIITKLASLCIIAGFLMCNYETIVTANEDSTEERVIDNQYKNDYYEYPMGFDQREDVFYIRNSYSSKIEWEIEPVDKQIWTNTEVYGRTIPNMDIQTGVFLNYGTEIHLIGLSFNGWDIIEYEDHRYFLWHEYWSAEEPPKRVAKAPSSTAGAGFSSPTASDTDASGMIYMGVYELTAYEYTGNPCADGAWPSEWYTAASNDPALWHRTIYIEGYGTFYVHDTGGMASNVIDLYLGDYNACIQFGRQSGNVYIIN